MIGDCLLLFLALYISLYLYSALEAVGVKDPVRKRAVEACPFPMIKSLFDDKIGESRLCRLVVSSIKEP